MTCINHGGADAHVGNRPVVGIFGWAMKKYGIWIDGKTAWIAELAEDGLHEVVVESAAERKPRIPGETSKKTTRASKGFDYESNQKARYEEELKKYLRKVAAIVSPPAEVFIFGPGETKNNLEKVLSGKQKVIVLAVRPADKLTLNQRRKLVREFFVPATGHSLQKRR